LRRIIDALKRYPALRLSGVGLCNTYVEEVHAGGQHDGILDRGSADDLPFMALLGRKQIAVQVMRSGPKTMNPQPAPSCLYRQGPLGTLILRPAFLVLALLVLTAVVGGKNLSAKTHALQATEPAQQQKTAQSRHRAAVHADSASTQRQPTPEAITSPTPIWPANQPPNQAKVSWDGRGLEIEAFNSSLNQILHEVAADTGAKLEGLTQDQRVFGSYGPGPEISVLSKLLEGSGYNVLMIGNGDTDVPLEIVLSARSPANRRTAANNQNRSNSQDDEAGKRPEPEPQPDHSAEASRPQTVQNPFGNGEPPRDPQQFMQEILQRQQQIDQQQHDQQNNPQQ
jgi:hypothetical protein